MFELSIIVPALFIHHHVMCLPELSTESNYSTGSNYSEIEVLAELIRYKYENLIAEKIRQKQIRERIIAAVSQKNHTKSKQQLAEETLKKLAYRKLFVWGELLRRRQATYLETDLSEYDCK